MNHFKITEQSSFETEQLEDKYASKGLFAGAVSYNPKTARLVLGDARQGIDENADWIINIDKLNQFNKLFSEGKVDAANAVKGIYSNKMLQMMANKKKMEELAAKRYVGKNILDIGSRIAGASGATATTDYNAIRQTGELLPGVIGSNHTNEDYQAHNIADDVNKDSVKFEYIKRTSARMIAQKNIADDQQASFLRHVYTTGTKEIFALGMALELSTRDSIDVKADIEADFKKRLPDAFLAAKNEMVLALLNAITGNNQGDWDSFSSGLAAVDASAQIQTAEDAVKGYGRPLVCVMDSTAFKGYMRNLQGATFQGQMQNIASMSTSDATAKSGKLVGNPSVTYYIDDGLTAATYVLAAKPAYMKKFNAMQIFSQYTNPRNPGQTKQSFWYEFFGVEETNTSAEYKGTSVLT